MAKRVFVISFVSLFLCFLGFYIVGLTGYFDYKQREKMIITKENMEKFEQDVSEGKNVDIKDYMNDEKINYNNNVSMLGMNLSNEIQKYTKIVLGGVFDVVDKVVR